MARTKEATNHLPGDIRQLRGKEMELIVITFLPLDGREIRAEDLFARAEEAGISRQTATKYLRTWETKGYVQRCARIVGRRPAICYRLALDQLVPWPRKYLNRALGYEDEWPDLFRQGKEGFRTRRDLERFLRIQDTALWAVLGDLLMQAAEAGNQEEARRQAEIAVDYVLRRWVVSLAEVMWVRRKDSAKALLRVSSRTMKGHEQTLDEMEREIDEWRGAAERRLRAEDPTACPLHHSRPADGTETPPHRTGAP